MLPNLQQTQSTSLSEDAARRRGEANLPGIRQSIPAHQTAVEAGLRGQPRLLPLQQAFPQIVRTDGPTGAMEAFVKTCQRWRLSEDDQIRLLGYTDRSYGVPLLLGHLHLPSQDVKDRIGYVVGISLGLGAMFDDAEAPELLWLKTPHAALGSRAPLDLMLNGRMAELIAVSNIVIRERLP